MKDKGRLWNCHKWEMTAETEQLMQYGSLDLIIEQKERFQGNKNLVKFKGLQFT